MGGMWIWSLTGTAAQIAVMSQNFYRSLENPPELETSFAINGAGRDSYMDAFLTKESSLQIGDRTFNREMCVAPITDDLLLG
jgi:hypothetical protein